MRKLKKQVARLKISHFLEKNKLVLFYQSNILSDSPNELSTLKKQSGLFPSYIIKNKAMDRHERNTLFVKNQIAQKAFNLYLANLHKECVKADSRTSSSNSALAPTVEIVETVKNITLFPGRVRAESEKESRVRAESALLPAFNRVNTTLSKSRNTRAATFPMITTEIANESHTTCTSLLQGNSILLGCMDLKILHNILKKYNQPIGGLYGTCVLDSWQVKRLAEYSQNENFHEKLITCLKRPAVEISSLMKNRLSILFLSIRQIQSLLSLQSKDDQASSLSK